MEQQTSPQTPSRGDEASALLRIAAAAAAERDAKKDGFRSDLEASRGALQEAVDAARLLGIGWTKIGDTLDIRSGNAYQRYRRSRRASHDLGFVVDDA